MNSEFNPKDILLVFGANIRKTREAQGLGIAELASSIKYDRGCLSLLEYGEQNIEYITALNLLSDNSFNSLTFTEDDYLLVFIENIQKIMRNKQLKQIEFYGATDIQTAIVSRIMHRKAQNPTIRTLYAMAYTVGADMYSLFSRTEEKI